MEAMRISDKPKGIDWDYDQEADVLYLSIGKPQPAVSVDIGDGLIARYSESQHEIVGLTVIGLRTRLLKKLADR
jgi:uncharacterized protein YuzE